MDNKAKYYRRKKFCNSCKGTVSHRIVLDPEVRLEECELCDHRTAGPGWLKNYKKKEAEEGD